MKFTPLDLPGAFLVEIEPREDERGFFARTFCREEFAAQGVELTIAQSSLSFNRARGTLRGLHYQAPPHAEAKVVACTAGAAFDVLVDLRRDSPAHRRWVTVELSAANHRMVYIPPGLAHGFMTLAADTTLQYHISVPYHQESARGVRWDDPAFGIVWPETPAVISARDADLPLFGRGA
ncbi:MAG: dTDP-4-dehydrorhamnose 3,5-epimerase [Planctomycetota bacterium]